MNLFIGSTSHLGGEYNIAIWQVWRLFGARFVVTCDACALTTQLYRTSAEAWRQVETHGALHARPEDTEERTDA